jgi:hypothetical protein
MRIGRASIGAIVTAIAYAALTTAAHAATAGGSAYAADPANGDIMKSLGFNNSIDLNTIASTVAGPVAFVTFVGGALNAAQKIQQSQGHWHELIHSGATTGFLGIMLGGAGMYWSKTHTAAGALLPHAVHAIRHGATLALITAKHFIS